MTVFSSMLVSFFLSNTFGCDIVTDRSYSTKDGVRIRSARVKKKRKKEETPEVATVSRKGHVMSPF